MKRVNGLFEKLITFDNLHGAYKKAFKGSPHSLEAKRFTFFLEGELLKLKEEVVSGRYKTGGFQHYKIFDPKERLISVAPFRDRVLHHAVVKILEPVFEPVFIHDSYATRKGKGTHAAIKRAQAYLRQSCFYLKADIKKHFENMDHDVLLDIVSRKIKDHRLFDLINTIIRGVPWEKGLPIGNLTSQFFANVYLDRLDHYVKEVLRVKRYVRYMDDMVFLHDDVSFLKDVWHQIEDYLKNQLKLELKLGGTYINKRSNGISFLGARIFPNQLRVKPSSLKRGLKKFQEQRAEFESGRLPLANYVSCLTSISGHLDFFNSYRLRCKTGQALNWF
ncbi:reverse transcriptase/maturase family protein [bacterium]|nr:reverse transcriptase/maturase family protein [bacterium]